MQIEPRSLLLVIVALAACGVVAVGLPTSERTAPTGASPAEPAPARSVEPWLAPDLAAEVAEEARDATRDAVEQQAKLAGARWFAASRASHRSPHATAGRSVRALAAWAKALPAGTRVVATYADVEHPYARATVTLDLELRTRGYTPPKTVAEPHVLETDVVLQLRRTGDLWRVHAARHDRSGIGAFSGPRVVRDGAITVIADRADAQLARDVAGIATRAAAGIRRDHRRLSHPGPVTIYLARNAVTAERITRATPSRHASAYVTDRGDVVLLTGRLERGPSDAALVSVVWHELAHVLLAHLDDLPSMLQEGIAEHVGVSASLDVPNVYYRFGAIRDMALERRFAYVRLLDERGSSVFYADNGHQRAIGYHFGLATVRWITAAKGQAVLDRYLLAAARTDGTTATRRVLGMSPAALEREVRGWIRDTSTLYG